MRPRATKAGGWAAQQDMWRGPDGPLARNEPDVADLADHEESRADGAMDRALLAKQRQRMRLKDGAPKKAGGQRETAAALAPGRLDGVDPSNMNLLVRQVLQRKHFGDVELYLSTTKKAELFRLMTDIAQCAYEIREKHEDELAKMRDELELSGQRVHKLAGQLIQVEAQNTEMQERQAEVQRRLQVTQEEYSAVVGALRDSETKLSSSQSTAEHQQQVLQGMARTLDERASQIQTLQHDLDDTKANYANAKKEVDDTKKQLQVAQLENDRLKEHMRDERQENKALAWELQSKTRECSDFCDQLDTAKSHILTLENQLQMEVITRQSLLKERDHARLVHRREREEWKRAQDSRLELDRQKAQEYRSMDMEIRRFTQAVSRLRSELETERVLREKAEGTAMKASGIAEELRVTSRTLQDDLQKVAGQLDEERSSREAKEGALAIAHRDLQSLQKRLREEEAARADAQGEAEALMHRMKLIRRDHLAMLHRVEAPAQLIARWREGAWQPHESAAPSSCS